MPRYKVEIWLDTPGSESSNLLTEVEVRAKSEEEAQEKALKKSGYGIGFTTWVKDDDSEWQLSEE